MRVVKNSVVVIVVMLLSGTAMAASQPVPADVNTTIPYASVLPKNAEIVPGAPGKNEFFIVAAEDAAKIKHLIDHTKPGRDIVASDIKSKQPIVKVKLDESNATLVSMDIVSSVNAVVKEAVKPTVQMTANDEVMSIFTKKRITPVGSRVATVPVSPKPKMAPAEIDEKPMLKWLASSTDAHSSMTQIPPTMSNNPLTTTAIKPANNKVVMPDTVAVKQTIQRPLEKPVELPLVSKETAPTLEMVLQQAKNGKDKVNNETAIALKMAVRTANAEAKKLAPTTITAPTPKVPAVAATKSIATKTLSTKTKASKKLVAKTQTKKQIAKKISSKTPIAGKIIAYEQIKPALKKGSWRTRHAAVEVKNKKVANKKMANKKIATTKVGVVHSYTDYLSNTDHHTRQSAE